MFVFKKSGLANDGRILREYVITNGSTISVGEAVKLASGKLVTWGTGGAGLGIVADLRKLDGSPLTDNGASGDFTNTYTAGAGELAVAVVDVSKLSVYSVPMDDTLGTTTGSNLAGYNVDCDAGSDDLDESSTVSTTASFCIEGLDPDPLAPANSVLVHIQESQFWL